jgi:hypothetical protein
MSLRESTSCQTCGHGSHCGSSKYVEFKDYACDGGEYRQVKICDSCNCIKCQNKKKEL